MDSFLEEWIWNWRLPNAETMTAASWTGLWGLGAFFAVVDALTRLGNVKKSL
jgi:hypothetical protein